MTIVLNGVSIDELKQQKKLIQKDAAAFISDSTDKVKELVAKIVELDDPEEFEPLAEQALETLENIRVVSGVSGVEYYFGYDSDYGSVGDVMSKDLESKFDESELDYEKYSELTAYSLIETLQEMESEVCVWNTSTC